MHDGIGHMVHPPADPPGQTPQVKHPPGQTPPWADTPRAGDPQVRHPPGSDPPGQRPPRVRHPSPWSLCGRYASYWNAFLLCYITCYLIGKPVGKVLVSLNVNASWVCQLFAGLFYIYFQTRCSDSYGNFQS